MYFRDARRESANPVMVEVRAGVGPTLPPGSSIYLRAGHLFYPDAALSCTGRFHVRASCRERSSLLFYYYTEYNYQYSIRVYIIYVLYNFSVRFSYSSS